MTYAQHVLMSFLWGIFHKVSALRGLKLVALIVTLSRATTGNELMCFHRSIATVNFIFDFCKGNGL